MNLKSRIAAGATAGAMVSLLGVAATPANAAPSRTHSVTATSAATTAAVTGTLEGRAFTGQMSNLSASVVNGTATLSGSLKGTGLPAAGTTFTTKINSVSAVDPVPAPVPVPVTAPIPSPTAVPAVLDCYLLGLDVADLRLNLLGLVILVPELHVIAGGVTGPNSLLGNVLCNLAGAASPAPAPAAG